MHIGIDDHFKYIQYEKILFMNERTLVLIWTFVLINAHKMHVVCVVRRTLYEAYDAM